MKSYLLLFAPILFIGTLVWGADTNEEFESLQRCVKELKLCSNKYTSLIPIAILNLDRKFHNMNQGVRYFEENVNLLMDHTRKNQVGAGDRLLVANAVEGCWAYQKTFEAHAKAFLSFLLSSLAVVLVLTLRLFFTIVPRGERNAKSSLKSDKELARGTSSTSKSSHQR